MSHEVSIKVRVRRRRLVFWPARLIWLCACLRVLTKATARRMIAAWVTRCRLIEIRCGGRWQPLRISPQDLVDLT